MDCWSVFTIPRYNIFDQTSAQICEETLIIMDVDDHLRNINTSTQIVHGAGDQD